MRSSFIFFKVSYVIGMGSQIRSPDGLEGTAHVAWPQNKMFFIFYFKGIFDI